MAILYPGGNEPARKVFPAQGLRFTLEELHALVAFELEFVRVDTMGNQLLIDEEGLIKHLPVNRALYNDMHPGVRAMVGPALLINDVEMPED